MKPDVAIVYLGGGLMAACAPTYSLTVQTSPQGALLVEEGTGARFLAPAVLNYELTPERRKPDGCFYVRPLVAHWTSGATAGPSQPISLCGNYSSWTLTIERPAGAPDLEQDLAAAETRERELEMGRIKDEITQLEAQTQAASSWRGAGYAIGCAVGGGCPNNGLGDFGTARDRSLLPSLHQSPSLAPDGTFVMGQPTLCPDGTFVGAGGCSLAPDGSYVGGHPQIAPNGAYVGGRPTICPDGTYVGGSRCVMAPDGSYLGAP